MIIGVSGKIGSGKDTIGTIIQYLTRNIQYMAIGYKEYEVLPMDFSDFGIKKFASKLKQCASIISGISIEDFEKTEIKDMRLTEEWKYYYVIVKEINGYGSYYIRNLFATEKEGNEFKSTTDGTVIESGIVSPTVRDLFLQKLGTDALRNILHPNVWVNALFVDYKAIGNYEYSEMFLKEHPNHISTKTIYPNWVITDVRFPNEFDAIKQRDGIVIRVNRNTKFQYDNLNDMISDTILEQHPSEIALDNHSFDYTIDNNGTIEELIENVKEILINEKLI